MNVNSRLETFCDGVFAIALTLLIIEIKIPATADLNKMPGAFFSVCLAVASDMEEEHREAQKIAGDFTAQTRWKPLMTTQIAGALKYTEYDFFKRLIMKMISKRDGRTTDTPRDCEFTDWEAVKKFVNGFVAKAAEKS